MGFKLKGTSDGLKEYNSNRITAEEMDQLREYGYACIRVGNKVFFANPHDEYDRNKLEKALEVPGYKWFHEDTGDKHWVIYNPKHYRMDYNRENQKILRLNTAEYDGSPIETPINASSLCGLFSWMTIPSNIAFSNRFDLRDIKDLSLLFSGSVIPDGLNIARIFNRVKVHQARYMFYKTKIPKDFDFENLINMEFVRNTEYMFSQASFTKNFCLNIDMSKVQDANHMFFKTTFGPNFQFGEKFALNPNCDTHNMFNECVINNQVINDRYIKFDEIKQLLSQSV